MHVCRDQGSGPFELETPTGTENYHTRRALWHRLNAMLPDERNLAVVTSHDYSGPRTDDGEYVHEMLRWEMEFGD